MCFNGQCFDFKDFAEKSIAVFICGPGHLEYPWALETALRLKAAGAFVTVFDVSDFALKYSARIKFSRIKLPVQSRKLLRSVFLKSSRKIEKVIQRICMEENVGYLHFKSKKKTPLFSRKKVQTLSSLQGEEWGVLNAASIVHTVLSSQRKLNLDMKDQVKISQVLEIEVAIREILELVNLDMVQRFDSYFMANGRQPISATLTLSLREREKKVVLYESGGGYIFPQMLSAHIDYWETSPANPKELQQKILCEKNKIHWDCDLGASVIELIKNRNSIPYSLNFLTPNPESFDKLSLGPGRNFAFFATSDWETSILYPNHYGTSFLLSQFSAVDYILTKMEPGDKLFIRLHPSDPEMLHEPDSRWERFARLDNVVLIHANSRINSYELAQAMDANFVWVSFIGYELALRNLPVAILGDSVYGPCLGSNWIDNDAKMNSFLQSPEAPTSNQLHLYGYYLTSGGYEIESSKTDVNHKIYLNGLQVDTLKSLFAWIPENIRLRFS